MNPLNKYFKDVLDKCDFYDKITFSGNYFSKTMPLLHMVNYDLLKRSLKFKKRTVIVLPNLYYTHYWAGLLFAINEIQKTLKSYDIYDKYEIGQKLLFNDKYIVEFQSFLDNGGIAVKTSDSIYVISEEFKGILKAIDTKKRLSPVKPILKSMNNQSLNLELTDKRQPIDQILNVNTMGDLPIQNNFIIMHTKVSNALEFMAKRKIGKFNINEIINFGSVDQNGNVKYIGAGQNSNINMVLSSDLLSIENLRSKNPDRSGLFIMDDANYIENNYSQVRDFINYYTDSCVVFCDYSNISKIEILGDLDFHFWNWKHHLSELNIGSKFHPYFKNLKNSINKNLYLNIYCKTCKFSELEDIVDSLSEIESSIPDDAYLFKSDYIKLYSLVLLFSRMIFNPKKNYIDEQLIPINEIEKNLDQHALYIEQDILDLTRRCTQRFKKIINTSDIFSDKKNKLIYDQIRDESYFSIYMLVQKNENVKFVEDFWRAKLNPVEFKNIYFISLNDLVNTEEFQNFKGNDSLLIVCGWLNKNNMQKILLEQVAFSNILLLFYSFELKWYTSVAKSWNNIFKNIHEPDLLNTHYGLNLNGLDYQPIFNIEAEYEKSNFDIVQFEDRINNYSNSKYKSSVESKNIGTKKIFLSNHKIMYATENHKFIILKNLYGDNNIGISKIDKLFANDTIVMPHAGQDLVYLKADQLLQKDGYSDVRKIASDWKDALYHLFLHNSNNVRKVIDVLKSKGCDMHLYTIKNWLFDDSAIGPQDEENLDVIKDATDEIYDWNYELNSIKNSIKIIRSYHQKAAFSIKNEFLRNISDTIDTIDIEAFSSKDYFEIDSEEYGNISFYKILNITTDEVVVNHQFANILHEDVM
ncbi:MAG: hypothetical protein HOK35_05375 [Cytophagia bacterium]|mgnify:FL=1|jgi:hypothetical protein|nr:hypothetical protein [Cytophagia bacterium]